jgi:hypothetical protein
MHLVGYLGQVLSDVGIESVASAAETANRPSETAAHAKEAG